MKPSHFILFIWHIKAVENISEGWIGHRIKNKNRQSAKDELKGLTAWGEMLLSSLVVQFGTCAKLTYFKHFHHVRRDCPNQQIVLFYIHVIDIQLETQPMSTKMTGPCQPSPSVDNLVFALVQNEL